MAKSQLRLKIEALREGFSERYPTLFDLENPVPLRIGIWRDLHGLRPDLPSGVLHSLLSWLTQRRAYLRACTVGAPRYGLGGPDGYVTEKQAAWACERLKKRIERAAELEKRFGITRPEPVPKVA